MIYNVLQKILKSTFSTSVMKVHTLFHIQLQAQGLIYAALWLKVKIMYS